MNDVGWEFDFEKKELKKIHVIDDGKAEMDYCFTKMMDGEKVSPVWSDSDEKNLIEVINILQNITSYDNQYDRYINFLKSFRQRMTWKPSEEEMEALTLAIHDVHEMWYKKHLLSLKQQLKQI